MKDRSIDRQVEGQTEVKNKNIIETVSMATLKQKLVDIFLHLKSEGQKKSHIASYFSVVCIIENMSGDRKENINQVRRREIEHPSCFPNKLHFLLLIFKTGDVYIFSIFFFLRNNGWIWGIHFDLKECRFYINCINLIFLKVFN